MDFIIGLLKSKNLDNKVEYNRIIVIINKVTKYAYFLLYKKISKVKYIAFYFTSIVIAQHRALDKIIINRDIYFTSKF